MEAAEHRIDVRLDIGHGVEDLLDAGMRAADHHDATHRRSYEERDLVHLPRPRLVRLRCDEKEPRQHFPGRRDLDEMCALPWRVGAVVVRRVAVVIAQIVRQRGDLALDHGGEPRRHRRTEATALEWRVNRHGWIFAQHVVEAGRVVVVPMTERDEIELFQIDAERGGVGRKVFGVAAGVEQNAPPAVLDESGIAPAALEPGWRPECIEQYRGPRGLLGSAGSAEGERGKGYGEAGRRSGEEVATRHHGECSLVQFRTTILSSKAYQDPVEIGSLLQPVAYDVRNFVRTWGDSGLGLSSLDLTRLTLSPTISAQRRRA